ncbi:periplasmic binding protein [Treponema primitia ZAS-2]|uniref:Periplasmic binding protein n=1 Tax=Treponema primitia (strain ATCC BAA-887 / DSM 12427 / ZAS-2) TaxID=545694 RepID=F5YKU4_TREPZ|nr:ABC transporter substrate-binding protein [Treponema primitia]AEF84039.1 periplasmic binding protein [Treponema primitia ZAS-2]
MKHRKIIGVVAMVLLVTLAGGMVYAGGKRESDPSTAANTVTITDAAGRQLTISQPVERVVILDTGPFEVLAALGVLDRVVGNHKSLEGSPLYPELAGVPVVATNSEVNFELLAQLQPQVVISSVRAHGVVTDEEALSGFNIVDIKLNLRNPDLMKEEILLLGKVFDREEKAREIAAFYDQYESFITGKVRNIPAEKRPQVFVEYHAGDFKTGAPNSRFYQQVVLAGANNIAVDLVEEPQVDGEWVARMNPDFFIREASGFGYTVENTDSAKSIYGEIKNREALRRTNAIVNNQLYLVSIDIYSRPGYIVGVSYLAKWFYPDLFSDFNPEQVHREYMTLFHPGREFRGLWTYNE